jgi:hypothetical protein
MTLGTVSAELRRCRGCGWYTHWLSAHGRCGDCTRGWLHCPRHGRLEHANGDHVRVTVREVLDAIPDLRGGR